MTSESRPCLFIGSSSETKGLAEALRSELRDEFDVQVWFDGTFRAGRYTVESLVEQAAKTDLAVMVFGPDDTGVVRGKTYHLPRDNVVYELGLFTGVIGRERSIVLQSASKPAKLPSDLKGITYLAYRDSGAGGAEAQVAEACAEVRALMRDLGRRAVTGLWEEIAGYWWQRIHPDSHSALSFVEITPLPALATVRLGGRAWDLEGRKIAVWESRVAMPDPEDGRLFYYWEGHHPRTPGDRFGGIGEVTFFGAPGRRKTGDGYFVSSTLGQLTTQQRKSASFYRADDADGKVMREGDPAEVRALVRRRLDELD